MSGALREHDELMRIVESGRGRLELRTLCEVADGERRHPVCAVMVGNRAPDAPAVGFFGGVHGLERIGTHVLLSFLEWLLARLEHDQEIRGLLSSVRLVFVPIVNPAGMRRNTRSNANGVDLMRNAPVDAPGRATFMLGGQRVSPSLPWFRGAADGPMELESQALCDLVRRELLPRPFGLALDCHSGFGLRDRIWFPYARMHEPFPHVAEVHALASRFTSAHPDHLYLFEPQSRRYRAHGDLWDHLCAQCQAGSVFLPLTLEMGAWRWIRKSPRQALSKIGFFNPLPADRLERVRRNHLAWLCFLCRAARDYRHWLPKGEHRLRHQRLALASWFGR